MTFNQYLATRRVTNTPQGDFTKDALDRQLPDVQTWHELKAHLCGITSDGRVIEAAHQVWTSYRAKLRRDRNA